VILSYKKLLICQSDEKAPSFLRHPQFLNDEHPIQLQFLPFPKVFVFAFFNTRGMLQEGEGQIGSTNSIRTLWNYHY